MSKEEIELRKWAAERASESMLSIKWVPSEQHQFDKWADLFYNYVTREK